MTRLQKFAQKPSAFFAVLLILGITAYGLHIYWMGFYWDDWPWIWFANVMGPQGMLKIDVEHRPISGVILFIGSLLAGENPVLWQVYNLGWRILGSFALTWALAQIWPADNANQINSRGLINKKNSHKSAASEKSAFYSSPVIWVSLLFLVYPGFNQQFVAVNNSRHIFPLMTFFLSLGLMVKAVQTRKHFWGYTSSALLLSLVTMFTTEYYYGLEFIRPVILWLLIRRTDKRFWSGVLGAFKDWLPYLIPLAAVFGWRFAISKSVNYEITVFNEVSASPGSGFLLHLWAWLSDLLASGFGAWGTIFKLPDPTLFGPRTQLYYWGIVLVVCLGVLLYLIFTHRADENPAWRQETLILGAAALVIAPLPFWVTDLDPKLAFPADRLLLPMILGSSLLVAALMDLIFRRAPVKVLILALMVGLAVGQHNQNAITYRRDWKYQIAFFQQLTTRIPDLMPNTAILSNELPNNRSTDNSLTAPLNWTYRPDFTEGTLPLNMFYIDLRFGDDEPVVAGSKYFASTYRFYPFHGAPEQSVVIYHRPPACLRVMDNDRDHYYPQLPDFVKDTLPYSDPARILTEPNPNVSLPAMLMQYPQPENWCYYFELADLARQREDWPRVAELGDVAFTLDDSPNHASERIPFIEGYAHIGRWGRAEELTFEALKINQFMGPMLCETWERIEADTDTSAERDALLETINSKLNCSLY
ncbi:MAG: hypothetical protein HN413_16035 [Chloroflexi bacterium]|jgi:hypothetical protein|nr:hypothetical protein [Chloroflexota bacterium]